MANAIEVPVSFGEAFDKLSILDIKKTKIDNENRRVKVIIEYDLLLGRLAPHFPKVAEDLYTQLLYVNSLLWDVEDRLRLLETGNKYETPLFVQLAREVYVLNDRRAEVKRAIDNRLGSSIQEVKSYAPYKKGKLLILGHLGMGDMIIMNGLIRYKALFHSEVRVAVFKKYADSVKFMFRDLNNVTYEEILCEADLSPNYAMVVPQRLADLVERDGYEYLPLGVHGRDAQWQGRGYDFAESFYIQAGVPYEVRERFGWVMRDHAAETRLYERITGIIGKKYRILHDDETRELLLDKGHPVLRDSAALPTFHLATRVLDGVEVWSSNIFDYLTLIDNAAEYHGMDSSFPLMMDLMRCRCARVMIHSYVKRDIHAKLYMNILVRFVDKASAPFRAMIGCIIEKSDPATTLLRVHEAIQQHPTATHVIAIRPGKTFVCDIGQYLTEVEPILWSDSAFFGITDDEDLIVFVVNKLNRLAEGKVSPPNVWKFTRNPLK